MNTKKMLGLAAEPVEPVAWINALKDAFFEGFTSVATYNDTLLNSPEEAWGNYKPPRAAPPQRKPVVVSVDELANHIRVVDGNHSLGAGALAEKIVEFLIERAHGIKE